jgi:hypothetical protein
MSNLGVRIPAAGIGLPRLGLCLSVSRR